jgi:hypothetical protein
MLPNVRPGQRDVLVRSDDMTVGGQVRRDSALDCPPDDVGSAPGYDKRIVRRSVKTPISGGRGYFSAFTVTITIVTGGSMSALI